MSYLNGLAVSPTLFSLSLNLAIRNSWSEPQSIPGLVFVDCIELLHLSISIYLYIVFLLRYIWKQTGLKYKVENVMSSNLENSITDVIFTLNVQFTLIVPDWRFISVPLAFYEILPPVIESNLFLLLWLQRAVSLLSYDTWFIRRLSTNPSYKVSINSSAGFWHLPSWIQRWFGKSHPVCYMVLKGQHPS